MKSTRCALSFAGFAAPRFHKRHVAWRSSRNPRGRLEKRHLSLGQGFPRAPRGPVPFPELSRTSGSYERHAFQIDPLLRPGILAVKLSSACCRSIPATSKLRRLSQEQPRGWQFAAPGHNSPRSCLRLLRESTQQRPTQGPPEERCRTLRQEGEGYGLHFHCAPTLPIQCPEGSEAMIAKLCPPNSRPMISTVGNRLERPWRPESQNASARAAHLVSRGPPRWARTGADHEQA
mmetsp:Transcript_28202/g.61369  ORF Transcript_28202/g.61369 Transcript_28202/m.61369 type:complete len:233 (+) Transcript_28202:203-901(+)